jgi:tRNA(Ile)-lysidine synthase
LSQEPVSPDEFAALMAAVGPFGRERRVAVAVSGGADSMALALLLAGWGRPAAMVVDHGLRPESGVEAAVTAARLADLGIAARVLPVTGLARGPALAERARTARYAALTAACRDAGLADLLLAHHAQDQAETLLLREDAGSGPSGLAGMAPVTHGEVVRLLRPLLPVTPARLRATLRRAGASWIEDPTNTDPATPRARLRAAFAQGDAAPVPDLCRAAQRRGAARREREASIADELARQVSFSPCGVAVIAGPTISAAALSALLWTVSGARHPPGTAAVARLARRLRPATLHGAVILPTSGGWLVGREAAAQAGAVPAQAGAVWDGRFRLRAAPPHDAMLGPLGDDAAQLRRWSDLPAALLRTAPAVRCSYGLFAVPSLSYPDRETCRAVPISFCPPRPAAPAPFAPV